MDVEYDGTREGTEGMWQVRMNEAKPGKTRSDEGIQGEDVLTSGELNYPTFNEGPEPIHPLPHPLHLIQLSGHECVCGEGSLDP